MITAPPSPVAKPGAGSRVTAAPWGFNVSLDGGTWQHPWQTQAFWYAPGKTWMAVVRPGFLNGHAPEILTTAGMMQSTPSFLAPITAWDGAADIAQAAQLADENNPYSKMGKDTNIWVPLYRSPFIPLAFGGVGSKDRPVPMWFQRRGMENRRLYAGDIVLHQPRLALTSQLDFPVDYVLGTSIVTQTLSERAPASNDRLKIVTTSQFDAVQNNNYDPGTGGPVRSYEEQPWDETLISTVYLLSPPGVTGKPDGSWSPFYKHTLFWNLNWSQPRLQPPPNLSVPGALTASFSALAGGIGQLVIGSLMGSINDMNNQAANIASANSLAGTFWTPTGGGSSATFPEGTQTPEAFGLSKSAAAQARRKAAIQGTALTDTLDPIFPFNALPFDLSRLN